MKPEVEKLGNNTEIANLFQTPELATATYSTLLEKVKPLASEGRGRRMVEHFQIYQEQRRSRQFDPRGKVVPTSIKEAQQIIRDEKEAMFLDRVVLKINAPEIPEDVVIVDLPGISVPNPRHREITFRFVREEAHALIFVLMATRLFDKDEIEIVEMVRSGESRIAEKTFWVLNRWDSLSAEQQRQTISDFEAKIKEFAIPGDIHMFKTNALYGLLSQLACKGEAPQDISLQRHVKDYEDSVSLRYGGSHQTALKESQVQMLQTKVFAFLNDRLRKTTLHSAIENANRNFCDPLPHHLRRAKDIDDQLLNGDLKRQEKQVSRDRTEERCLARKADLEKQLREMRAEVAEKRSTILASKTEELLKTLETKIAEGEETDAYSIYLEIISESELRKYPYHFEIEMRIVDKLNTMLKQEFRKIVREQVLSVFEDYASRVRESLEDFRKDVGYSVEIMAPFDEVLTQGRTTFHTEVDGHVKSVVGDFDKLLVDIPSKLIWWGGNQVLEGLEKASRAGSDTINNPNESVRRENFEVKTEAIRKTLKEHYIQRVREEHKGIARNIPTLIINNMQDIEKRLIEVMQTKYRPALEVIMSHEVEEEFSSQKRSTEDRSRQYREAIDQIEQISREMSHVINNNGSNR
ncbi:MAG: dynamin family protein [Pirellulales bacterium]